MNNQVVLVALAAFTFLVISCNDLEKTGFDKSLADTKAKKEVRLTKNKKKEKKKLTLTKKRKTETPVTKTRTMEPEAPAPSENSPVLSVLGNKINDFAAQNGFSDKYCFLIDMSLPSGRKRFFVYDLEKNSVAFSGLVAHGSCNETFLSRARFSNALNCGCSSLGKYKVGEFYRGQYGKSFKLYGLDNSNSNAYKRAVVIHGYDCVPDQEIYPRVLCNSLGCVMVSYRFFDRLTRIIQNSDRPIVLWVYQ